MTKSAKERFIHNYRLSDSTWHKEEVERVLREFVEGFIKKKDRYLREELGFTDRDMQMLPSEFAYIVELEEELNQKIKELREEYE